MGGVPVPRGRYTLWTLPPFGGSSLKELIVLFCNRRSTVFRYNLPRNAQRASKVGISITRENLTKGDLVFFHDVHWGMLEFI